MWCPGNPGTKPMPRDTYPADLKVGDRVEITYVGTVTRLSGGPEHPVVTFTVDGSDTLAGEGITYFCALSWAKEVRNLGRAEPPVGTVVLDKTGQAWFRSMGGLWYKPGGVEAGIRWQHIVNIGIERVLWEPTS